MDGNYRDPPWRAEYFNVGCGWEFWPCTLPDFILTFPDTLTWHPDWAVCWAFVSRITSAIPIFQKVLRNSGEDGIFPQEPGLKDMFTFRWGGNRKGGLLQIRNILIVWLLTGIWHGAALNFLLWGNLFRNSAVIRKIHF